jgi:membrane protease subunit (stomatin/prohibitin family)
MLFFWPVLITQIWGLVEQSSLDDRALALAEQAIAGGAFSTASASSFTSASTGTHKFCTSCGTKTDGTSKFCPECGAKLG